MEELIKLLQENGFNESDCEKISQCVKDSKYVPIARLNEEIAKKKNLEDQLKNANDSINEIKKSAGNNEELTRKIQELKDANKKAAEEMNLKMENFYKENTIKDELRKVCYDPDYLYTKLNLENIIHDKDHKVVAGLKEQLETMKNDEMLKRQFIDNSNSVAGGFNPSNGQQTPPPKKEGVSDAVALMQGYFGKQ